MISYETSPGEIIEVFVGYVHNWVMYMLMTGGVVGLIAYTTVLLGPAKMALKYSHRDNEVLASVAVLSLYALFFAVFRLIPFQSGSWRPLGACPQQTLYLYEGLSLCVVSLVFLAMI